MPVAIKAIVEGLAADEPIVAFQLPLVVIGTAVASLPAHLRDWLARARLLPGGVYNYWRRKRASGDAPAGAKPGK